MREEKTLLLEETEKRGADDRRVRAREERRDSQKRRESEQAQREVAPVHVERAAFAQVFPQSRETLPVVSSVSSVSFVRFVRIVRIVVFRVHLTDEKRVEFFPNLGSVERGEFVRAIASGERQEKPISARVFGYPRRHVVDVSVDDHPRVVARRARSNVGAGVDFRDVAHRERITSDDEVFIFDDRD